MSTTLCIELNRDEFLDDKVVRLEKGWKLHFMLGESLRGLEVRLLVPDAVGSAPYEAFFPGIRLDARESLEPLQGIANLDSQIYQEFSCDNFGLFSYEFFEPPNSTVPIGRGYFFVIPQWQIADGAKTLSLNSLNVCTYLTKLLGPLVEWEKRLRVAKESGFNVIHLTPVQKLGISNSSYSIAEYDQLNPLFDADFDALDSLVKKLEYEWQMLTIQDVVWNHAAKNAKWLHEHPECAYNLQNSPHLRPAYILDRALSQFSREIATDKWAPQGLPSVICEESHLSCLRHLLSDQVLPSVKLWEFFQVDVDKMLQEFEHLFKEAWPSPDEAEEDFFSIPLDQDEQFRRFGSTIDLKRVARIFAAEKLKFEECTDRLRAMLRDANAGARHIVEGHIAQAIDAILGHVTYERVAGHGPRKGKVTAENPLVTEYFLHPVDHQNQGWEEDEKFAYDPTVSPHLMAFNGWVMSANPLANFAEWPSQVYLRRELVCWGDSVKLNYGRERADCPFLWEYMVRYTEQCARIFHGFRIDNAHSTPIHVAEYLLKAARQVRPNFYVVAELFTGSERHDNIFVNRLGITSLIREAQNAPDSHEQGRFVYRYGGDPVGAFHHKSTRPAPWAVAHALFYDQTHDNPSPIQKRTAYDVLPTAAMTAIGYCASGSVRGYDEFVPAHIDVVKETRLYRMWSEFGQEPEKEGMFRARRLLNDLHYQLGITGFSEIFVDQVNEDVVAVTRHNPCTQESVLLIAHTCFSKFKWTPSCRPISVDGDIAAILFELKTVEEPMKDNGVVQKKAQLPDRITGLPNFHVECYENVPLDKSDAIEIEGGQQIRFKLFLSGSVVVLKINPKADTKKACAMIQETISNKQTREEARKLLSPLTFHDFNFLLFRCEPEEMAEFGSGAFDISKHGKLPYCGLMGIRTLLQRIQKANDLGHPLCDNLRHGTWLADYTIGRLQRNSALQPLAQFLQKAFAPLRDVPHYSRPCYFELLFSCFYAVVEEAFLERQFNLVGTNIKYIPRIKLTERLCIAANAFLARISNALLPPTASMPAEQQLSLSAGLPHFAEGIWRNWGRDTFIALPGLLLLTGRYEEARQMILAYAGTLRHGLIPNLLAEGKAPRYNCRDAVWFWLAAIVQYVELLPWEDGKKILEEPVLRLYPTDDSNYGDAQRTEPLHATMYEALCRHFAGIDFRERNAGPQIDEHMRDEGFNVRAYIDPETGLVFGGNRWNCGTWMDKMGSSERAGNRGEPATPRDGAAVELQGLALRVAKALDEYSRIREEVAFPYTAMKAGDATLTWADWAAKIRNSFTDKFFVGPDCEDQYVNRRGIIKDTFGSSLQYTDFQLRPNFCIALDAAPDIIDSEKAWSALETAGKVLAQNAPLGICTLDPEDWAYNGHYNNDDDGMNKATAKGWNYHQGPEWLWIACTYMNAKLKVAQRRAQETGEQRFFNQTLEEVRLRLCRFERTMAESDWASLPELTNRAGLPCAHSCPAQAWSIGCALETVHLVDSFL